MKVIFQKLTRFAAGIVLLTYFSYAIADSNEIVVANTTFAPTTTVAGKSLVLNGAGLRTKFIVKVYSLGLYVPTKSSSAKDLVSVNGPELIKIHMLRKVDAKTFVDALREGLENNNSKDTLAKLKPQIDALCNLMKSVGAANDGDVIDFEYVPGSGTQIYVNDSKLGDTISGGSNFYSAILKIWLGDNPVDKDLKASVVGQ